MWLRRLWWRLPRHIRAGVRGVLVALVVVGAMVLLVVLGATLVIVLAALPRPFG